MRLILALLAAVAVIQDHPAPPDGWMCQPQTRDFTVPPDHVCGCHRECSEDEDGTTRVREDPQCKVYCHADHCSCPTVDCEKESQ